MGTKYSNQSSTGYNSSPPADDGSTTASNKITWATIKSKLSDVLKTFIEAVNSSLVTALDTSATTTSSNYTTLASDHQKPIEVSGTTTISLGDASSMAAGYQVPVFNKGTALVTVTPVTGADTLNGTAGASVVLPPWTGMTFVVNQAANGYDILAASSPYRQGADIASATTTSLRNATGDYVNVTGTTTITGITLDKGQEKTVQFAGILILTNGASLILPGGANITTAAGDTAIFRGEASGVVRCISYTRAVGNTLDSGWKLLSTGTASGSATLDFTGLTGYSAYAVVLQNVLPATDGADLYLRFSTNGGSSYDTSATYRYAYGGVVAGTGVVSNSSNSAGQFIINNSMDNVAGNGTDGQVLISTVSSGHLGATWTTVAKHSSDNTSTSFGGGQYAGAGTVNAIRFIFSGGNIASGSVFVYGLRGA